MKQLLFFTVFLFFQNLYAQSVDDVLKKHIAFMGGEKKWKSIHSITTSGEYDYGGMKFPFQAYSKAPNKYKFIVPFNGKYYAQAFDGIKGWKIDAFKNETTPTPLTGKEALDMANEADVELEIPFINYEKKGHKAILEKTDTTIQNNQCYKVFFNRKSGEKEVYYFDVKTYALVMKKAVSKNAEIGGAIMTTLYSDYRDIGGIKIPFHAASDVNGQVILTITVDKAQVNEPIDNKIFEVPN
ncbi:MAG TPA: hypothetical protein VIM65_05810 [Cyclobacteriaceae bacterium]